MLSLGIRTLKYSIFPSPALDPNLDHPPYGHPHVAKNSDPMSRNANRAPRKAAFIKAKIRRNNDWADASIANVSTSGLMIKTQSPPEVGSIVELRHRGWNMQGEVVWNSRSRAGIRAFEPIDIAELTGNSGLGQSVRSDTSRPTPKGIWHWARAR
ncbi:PilZ domain-containing protein [Altererythrobacter sp. N1]|nr:PilZ domain-containing protein [Altererythrobacter sp. N1]